MGGATSKEFPVKGSIIVEKGSGDNGDIRGNTEYPELVPTAFPEVLTLYDAFQRGLKQSAKRNCLGYRPMVTEKGKDGKEVSVAGPFKWFNYEQTQEMVNNIGSGMINLGLVTANDLGHKLVGLYSKNRWEWVVAEQACHAYGFADVPLYDTLGPEATSFIVGQTGMSVIFTDAVGVGKIIKVRESCAAETATLKHVISFTDVTEADRAAATAVGVTLRSFTEVLNAGKASPQPHAPPKPEDLGFICYTSGTTGMPKGAMILHKNMVADASSAYTAKLNLCKDDVHLSYLPLAHVFERLVQCGLFMGGASIGFFQGDSLKIMEDIKALRPTIFPSVPRLYNRIYDKITAGVKQNGGVKESLFNRAFAAKRYYLNKDNVITHGVWDRLVFGKVAGRVGLDRCRVMLTGSAPIASHVLEFLRIVFSTNVCEGYGQTECSAAATLTSIFDQATIGHVGGPLACNRVKLVSVSEMDYKVTDSVHGCEVDEKGTVVNPGIKCFGRGEVCYKGHNVFAGYYKDEAKTKEAIDEDGWLHSGDIGLWDENGNLRIIDRKKNIFKLSQGEYVAAEKIENVYIKSPFVGQSFVYGDSLHAVLVAIVVPDVDIAADWAKKNGHEGKSVADICALPEFKKAVMDDMAAMEKEAKLQGFEKAKDILLEPTAWTPDDLLTPSFKLKRADAKKKYLVQIDAMYAKLGDLVAGKSGLKQGAV